MGGAIARGLSQSSIVAPSEITVSNRGEEKLNELKSFNPSDSYDHRQQRSRQGCRCYHFGR